MNNHFEHAKSYLRGLEGTRSKVIEQFGVKTGRLEGRDMRSVPKIDIPMLIKEISRVKKIIRDMSKQ